LANWLYTLEVKDLLAQDKGDDFDYDAHAVEIAPTIRDRIRALAARVDKAVSEPVLNRQGALFAEELEDVAQLFDEVADMKPPNDEPKRALNFALSELYDLGDSRHRIWIK
jgi:hypothetical protein